MAKAISKILSIVVVALIVTLGLIGIYESLVISSTTSSQSTTTLSNLSSSMTVSTQQQFSQSNYNSSTSDGQNLTSFILLNNIVESATAYRIYDTMYIESWSNMTATGIMLWSVNHTTSITVTGTSMYVEPHFNCGIMQTFGSVIQWPVFAIYNVTNIPYPVTVYIGQTTYDPSSYQIANTTTTVPVQNYFIVGYVTNGLPYLIYSSHDNVTNVNIVISN